MLNPETYIPIGIQAGVALIHFGIMWQSKKETERRLDNVEDTALDHGGRIARVEGHLDIVPPTARRARAAR